MSETDARLPIHNRGFLFGDGCFETIRIHGGAPFRPDAHFARLRQSLEILRIESPCAIDVLRSGSRKLVEENRVDEGLLRITITAGERATVKGSATITSRALPDVPEQPALHIATSARRLSGPLSQCKSLSRAAESVALREAQEEGALDAILLNEKGRVAETTARNLFIVADAGAMTPPTYDGALPGVTRAAVFDIAKQENLNIREVSIAVDQLRSASELFLSGCGVGILGIASVDGHRYEAPGAITQRVQCAYAALLDRESKW